jgi:hypothetical protein
MVQTIGKQKLSKVYVDVKEEAYQSNQVLISLQPLKVFKPSKTSAITQYQGLRIWEHHCSEKYSAFDFGRHVCELLSSIEEYFKPLSYNLTLVRGFQELRLTGEDIWINNERYFKMFTISSSSNGYYPLSVNAGLLREVCSNGLVVGLRDQSFNIKARHYPDALEGVLHSLREQLPLLHKGFEAQNEMISKIGQTPVSLKDFLQVYLKKNTDGEMVKVLLENTKRLLRMLQSSKSDGIELDLLTSNQKNALESPLQLLNNAKNYDDLAISKQQLFNCYTELFRNRPNPIIEKETTRIYEVLVGLN